MIRISGLFRGETDRSAGKNGSTTAFPVAVDPPGLDIYIGL